MGITADCPLSGIVAEVGGQSRPLLLRNSEIERFEVHHGLGIFQFLEELLGKGEPQARHCRDIVALGLVGGGLLDKSADKVVDDMPPHENMRIRSIAQDLVFAAFNPPEVDKKKADVLVGSSSKKTQKSTTQKAK